VDSGLSRTLDRRGVSLSLTLCLGDLPCISGAGNLGTTLPLLHQSGEGGLALTLPLDCSADGRLPLRLGSGAVGGLTRSGGLGELATLLDRAEVGEGSTLLLVQVGIALVARRVDRGRSLIRVVVVVSRVGGEEVELRRR
jgi:hypothetical protein